MTYEVGDLIILVRLEVQLMDVKSREICAHENGRVHGCRETTIDITIYRLNKCEFKELGGFRAKSLTTSARLSLRGGG